MSTTFLPKTTLTRQLQQRTTTLAVSLLAIAASGLVACNALANDSATRPNIIFIMADDLGQYDLGCCGQDKILTPRLDQMAAEGCFFSQCYAGAAVCAPSRCALMTGMHMGHARVRNNSSRIGGVPPQGRVPLRSEDITVAEVLDCPFIVGERRGRSDPCGLVKSFHRTAA